MIFNQHIQIMEEEIEKRKEAINRWMQGITPLEIAISLDRTRQWVYKWVNRYKSGSKTPWYESDSRAPKSNPQQLSEKQEQLIIELRNKLSGAKYSQIGAITIQYEFYHQGLDIPPVWTINRILSKHGLISKSKKHKSKHIAYPSLFCNCHQMDLVGPRYLKGGFRYYVLNIIDVETHYVYVHPVKGKSADFLLQGLISFWQQFEIPDSIQMDNEMVFRGSNKYPRSLGLILRFILSQGVVPIFIPTAEPWRNGQVEKFNDTFDKKFLKVQKFDCFKGLEDESLNFSRFHNNNHRYSSQNQKTPVEAHRLLGHTIKLAPNYQLPVRIGLEGGVILFVRFIRSNLRITILGTAFAVKKELMYSYVVAELVIDIHTLRIKQDNIVHHVFDFIMPVDW